MSQIVFSLRRLKVAFCLSLYWVFSHFNDLYFQCQLWTRYLLLPINVLREIGWTVNTPANVNKWTKHAPASLWRHRAEGLSRAHRPYVVNLSSIFKELLQSKNSFLIYKFYLDHKLSKNGNFLAFCWSYSFLEAF